MNPIRQIVFSSTGYHPTKTSWAWIDPRGKIHEVGGVYDNHSEWARNYLQSKGITRDDWTKKGHYGPTHYLVNEEKWVAATNELSYFIPRRPTSQQLQTIADILEKMVLEGTISPDGKDIKEGVWIEYTEDGYDYEHDHLSVEEFMYHYLGRRRVEEMYERLLEE